MAIVGYKRVSSIDQNEARQLDGKDLDECFLDKLSGKTIERPQLQACLKFLRKGDTLMVHSMDRLARNMMDLKGIVKGLTDRGISVQFVKESLTFTGEDSPMANLLLNLLGSVAEFELALNQERRKEGILIAKRKGLYKGRKPVLSADRVTEIRNRVEAGENKAKIARELGISRAGLYVYLGRDKERKAVEAVFA